MTYRMCKLLIARGKVEGMQDKLDLFFAFGRLTADQYDELCQLLAVKLAQLEGLHTEPETENG